jgi:hypothetical protein
MTEEKEREEGQGDQKKSKDKESFHHLQSPETEAHRRIKGQNIASSKRFLHPTQKQASLGEKTPAKT